MLVALVSVALLAARSFVRSRTVGLAIAVVAACGGDDVGADDRDLRRARPQHASPSGCTRSHPSPSTGSTRPPAASRRSSSASSLARTQNPIWLLEFWNYAIDKIWSLDGTAPLPSLSPDLGKPDGTMSPDPGRQLGRDRERRRGRRREGRRAAQRDAALARAAARPLPEYADRRLPGRLDELESERSPSTRPRTASRAASPRLPSRGRGPAAAASRRPTSLSGSGPSPSSTSSPASRASTRSSGASCRRAASPRSSRARPCRTTSR